MMMCRTLGVSRSGFYQWLSQPLSDRTIEDQRLLELIRASYTASGGVYGAPRVFLDLREAGETCGHNRVARIMQVNKIKALRGYKAPRHIDWLRFCREHNLQPSMSRRGKCWDNAVAESFFSSLKKERVKKRIYKTRDLARADIFDYIEVFYNRQRRHSHRPAAAAAIC
jgi:putative transposase